MTTRRPRWRAYLLLSRVSNLPTVWSNVLAGYVLAAGVLESPVFVRLALGVSLLYTSGMFLNDAFDYESDTVSRPDRPLPAGDVSVLAAFVVGFVLMIVGELVVASQGLSTAPALWSLVLAVAIIYYNVRHKRDVFGPLVMGLCRGLVYCLAASAVAPSLGVAVFVAAAVMTLYVLSLTFIAKKLGPKAGVVIPLMIAGISVVDAVVIGFAGGDAKLILAAIGAGALTLALQRVVP
ncbi:MAG TPA: UbiA family prenyltransferase, partial [Vicinamibacterales bacterium]|nr:UbiA family prenyltransferase [Vicinamibacterales bacterium]